MKAKVGDIALLRNELVEIIEIEYSEEPEMKRMKILGKSKPTGKTIKTVGTIYFVPLGENKGLKYHNNGFTEDNWDNMVIQGSSVLVQAGIHFDKQKEKDEQTSITNKT